MFGQYKAGYGERYEMGSIDSYRGVGSYLLSGRNQAGRPKLRPNNPTDENHLARGSSADGFSGLGAC